MSGLDNLDTDKKLVLIGDSNVGKTCLISSFMYSQFDPNEPSTNGANYSSKKIEYEHLNKTLPLDIWDTAGQEKYRALTKLFYKDASMIILVYDVTRKETFDNLKNFWYPQIKESCDKKIILAIAGNKSDLYVDEDVPEQEARDFAESINAIFALTSAKDNDGVEKLFRDIGNKYLESNFQEKVSEAQKKQSPSFVMQKKEYIGEKNKKKACC